MYLTHRERDTTLIPLQEMPPLPPSPASLDRNIYLLLSLNGHKYLPESFPDQHGLKHLPDPSPWTNKIYTYFLATMNRNIHLPPSPASADRDMYLLPSPASLDKNISLERSSVTMGRNIYLRPSTASPDKNISLERTSVTMGRNIYLPSSTASMDINIYLSHSLSNTDINVLLPYSQNGQKLLSASFSNQHGHKYLPPL
jgi:hypothetical protein